MKTVKAHHDTVDFTVPTESIILDIKGLRQNDNGTFTLENVTPTMIDYESVVELLKMAGVDEKDAHPLTEEFANNVFRHTLARQLAARTHRII